MRADTASFAAKNLALAKRPKYVIEVAFDSDNAILRYFTSASDCALPGGASAIQSVVEGLSGTSQTLNPDTANASIGAISFDLVDKASIVTTTLGGQLELGRSTRRQRVRAYVGYEGLAWADYTLVQTQLVGEIAFREGLYPIKCQDVQREMRKEVFDLAKTTLSATLSAAATTINVYDTSAFAMVAHGASYSDAPSSTVGYVKIDDEWIRYTGKTATSFTGCTRGVMNTLAVEHAVDDSAPADRRPEVKEMMYLEMPAVKLAYALLTGTLYGQGGATLPASWHCGIPAAYVREADFTGLGKDLWDPADDTKGFHLRFAGEKKGDGKRFVETQILLACGAFMPVYADGALGVRRMANILAGAAYTKLLDETNLTDWGELTHDMGALHNVIAVSWNYEDALEKCTRANVLVDATSQTIHGKADPLNVELRGLHGSIHSSTILAQVFDKIRDRYSGPPLRLPVKALPSLNTLEVGDIVRVKLANVRDFTKPGGGGPIDRSFEVQQVSIDWMTGEVGLKLFGSSQAPGAISSTGDATVLTQPWFTGTGTALSSALTITGTNPGHVSASGSLAGNADLNAAAAIYYYDGDLIIDAGVTIDIAQNVQLRVRGALQNRGTITGKGAGLAGAAALNPSPTALSYNPGTAGAIGTTEAGGGVNVPHTAAKMAMKSTRGGVVEGVHSTVPAFHFEWDGSALAGMPSDLRGSSGSSGMPFAVPPVAVMADGGAGGAGGAGLAIVCRGFSQALSGKIDLSGGDGSAGETVNYSLVTISQQIVITVHGGGGAGGAPGALLVVLDGATASATDLNESQFVALYGATPIPPGTLAQQDMNFADGEHSSYFVGTGDGTTFPLPSLSGARGGCRVQYVPNTGTATADPGAAILKAPTNLGAQSGTDQLLTASDGTVIVRARLDWTAAPEPRAKGYDVQFKKSADSAWQDAPPVLGQASTMTRVAGLQDGVNYDFQIRSAGPAREVSPWLTLSNYPIIGKTAKPSNVGTLVFSDPILSWPKVTDADLRGYVVRYQASASTDWDSATPAHKEGFITDTRFDVSLLVGGAVTMLVKAIDTSGNLSAAVASLAIDLRPAQVSTFTVTRQPDGTREYAWTLSSPPVDLEGYKVRYYLGATADWSAMTALHEGVLKASPFESNQLAAGTWTLAIKAVDWAGNESASALFITSVALGDPRVAGSIEDLKEEPTWTGTKTGCVVDEATGWLIASDATTTWATLPATWDAWTSWTMAPTSPITYVRQIDCGVKTKFTPLVTVVADGSQTIEEQHSDDDITYTAYAAVGPQVDARYIRIRVTVTGAFPKVKSERIILSATPVTEVIEDLDTSTLTGSYRIGVGDIRLPITKSYGKIKAVGVILQGVGAGWSVDLIDKDTSVGPRIKLYNGSNNLADAIIDAPIEGI